MVAFANGTNEPELTDEQAVEVGKVLDHKSVEVISRVTRQLQYEGPNAVATEDLGIVLKKFEELSAIAAPSAATIAEMEDLRLIYHTRVN